MAKVSWSENLGAFVDEDAKMAIDGDIATEELNAAIKRGDVATGTPIEQILGPLWSVADFDDSYPVVYEWPTGWLRAPEPGTPVEVTVYGYEGRECVIVDPPPDYHGQTTWVQFMDNLTNLALTPDQRDQLTVVRTVQGRRRA